MAQEKRSFSRQLYLLMQLGTQHSLDSHSDEEILYGFDQILQKRLGFNVWNDKWESIFPSDEEKINYINAK